MVQPRLGHSLKQNVRHGGQWGLRRKRANEKLPETGMATGKKLSFLALCLNSLPSNFGGGDVVHIYRNKNRSVLNLHKTVICPGLMLLVALNHNKNVDVSFSLTWARLNF